MPWCSVWKGTAQDCIDHLWHHACSTVVASTLGKCFPPWTVTRLDWVAALGPRVSGIAMDVMSWIATDVPGSFTGTVCSPIVCRTSRFVVRS